MAEGIKGFQKGNKFGIGNAFKNAKIEIKCENCGKIFKDFRGNKRKFCSRKCKNKKQRELRKGKNCNFWKGGITKLSKRIRESLEYKKWRIKVFTRDNWTCQGCNKRGSIVLEAHHTPKTFSELLKENNIKTFEQAINCIELFKADKGVTLCSDCHKLTKSYSKQNYGR